LINIDLHQKETLKETVYYKPVESALAGVIDAGPLGPVLHH
jgi:hypothetical protein